MRQKAAPNAISAADNSLLLSDIPLLPQDDAADKERPSTRPLSFTQDNVVSDKF
jgi:hypothetical protein